MIRTIFAFALLLVLALQFSRVQADEPNAAAAARGDDQSPQICQPRIRTYPPITYFFISKETSFDQLQATIQELMPAVEKEISDSKGQIVGPPVLIYHHVVNDPAARFKLDVGFPVREGAKASGNAQVKQLDKFHCLSQLYIGPTSSIHQAYEKLAANAPAGKQPLVAEESRQMLLYWEGSDSPNNVIQIMIGLPGK
jgi:effector-binding domain-containing protein